jgi:hypothetical protein
LDTATFQPIATQKIHSFCKTHKTMFYVCSLPLLTNYNQEKFFLLKFVLFDKPFVTRKC